jgi:hypothetical protein
LNTLQTGLDGVRFVLGDHRKAQGCHDLPSCQVSFWLELWCTSTTWTDRNARRGPWGSGPV